MRRSGSAEIAASSVGNQVELVVRRRRFPPLLPGSSDDHATDRWLSQYEGHTLRAYKREIGGFRAFLKSQNVPFLRVVTGDHVRAYVTPISETHRVYVTRVLKSFFNWLIEADHVPDHNPVNAAALNDLQAANDASPEREKVAKQLTEGDVRLLTQVINELESTKLRNYETRRWIFWLLFFSGISREEASGFKTSNPSAPEHPTVLKRELQMRDFEPCDSQTNDRGNVPETWELWVVGKRNKLRKIAVSDQLLSELIRYRKYLKLSDLPDEHDITPAIVGPNGNPLSAQGIYNNFKELCKSAAAIIEKQGGHEDLVVALKCASPDWLSRRRPPSHTAS